MSAPPLDLEQYAMWSQRRADVCPRCHALVADMAAHREWHYRYAGDRGNPSLDRVTVDL